MRQRLSDSRLGNIGAAIIFRAFDEYRQLFKIITRRAKSRFESRDWRGVQADSAERIDLYKKVVDKMMAELMELLDERADDKLIWAGIKAVYSGMITERDDWELAETFFNSATRRIFTTVGVDPQIEFVDTDFEIPPTVSYEPIYQTYRGFISTGNMIKKILSDYQFRLPYQDIQRDVKFVTARVTSHLEEIWALKKIVERTEMVRSVFYHGMGAYLVGKMFSGEHTFPFVLALHNHADGIIVDAVLLNEDDVSILFSFTRSYFLVDVEWNYDLVSFLKSVIPRKRTAELYISIGHNKHGKTELYRDLLHYMASSEDKFEIARGQPGMVMTVFMLPGYDLVFKLIKDNFAYPKKGNRELVVSKYHLVFKHDRAGRLVDAQVFEHLKFERRRFSGKLLRELLEVAAKTVEVNEDHVIIRHAYIERRVIPLDLFIREADESAARAAVIDYGNSIKDMAANNIFPGDMMLKNFGVTRHGRVIFYDYDELALLTSCNFRHVPPPSSYDEALSDEPWFAIAENDVFPEEFRHFLGLPDDLYEVFHEKHADLLTVEFWREFQERLNRGEVIHVFPYDRNRQQFENKPLAP
jgi:isocitrate dehydrogenase kinase/phosphatase